MPRATSATTVTVHSPHLPAGGANRLSLEADVVMKLGNGEKTVEQKNVNLKADTITVGPSKLIVMTQEPVDGVGQGNGMQVILFHQGPIQREFKKVAFIGPDGSEIEGAGTAVPGQSGSCPREGVLRGIARPESRPARSGSPFPRELRQSRCRSPSTRASASPPAHAVGV